MCRGAAEPVRPSAAARCRARQRQVSARPMPYGRHRRSGNRDCCGWPGETDLPGRTRCGNRARSRGPRADRPSAPSRGLWRDTDGPHQWPVPRRRDWPATARMRQIEIDRKSSSRQFREHDQNQVHAMVQLLRCHGQGGIRTREGLAPPHAFQACALSHSATRPYCLWAKNLSTPTDGR